MMRIRLLGDVGAVDDDGVDLPLGGPRQRRVLAALAIRSGEFVSIDRLEEAIWAGADERPQNPIDTIRTYVARLRQILGSDHITTGDNAYRFDLAPDRIDARLFERLVAEAVGSSVPAADRVEQLGRALRLWGGSAFGALAADGPFRAEGRRLDDLRLAATEAWLEARLDQGEHRELVGDIEILVADRPLREGPRRLLMTALHRGGARVEALRAFQDYRTLLGDESGLEPSSELVALDRWIARDDHASDDPAGDDQAGDGPVPGRPLRGYRLLEPIGDDGAGVVYRGLQPWLDRAVAITVIGKELADRPNFIRRFEAEAHLVARLEHPNLVPLYDYWRDPSGAYLVTRLLDNGSLADRIVDGHESLDAVRTWLPQVASALEAAHRAGVVHRQLRPTSVRFDRDEHAYLGHFGLAAFTDDGPTGNGNGEGTDRAADIRALGLLVHEALAGTTSNGDQSTEGIRATLASRRPELAAGVGDVLARATALDPSDRHPSAQALADDLLSVLDGASRSRPPRPRPSRPIGPANPYRGLRAFDEGDAELFFGRQRLASTVVESVGRDRCAFVIGPSGSGKSSLVRAGVVPALRRLDGCYVATMVPGLDPFAELEAALLRVLVDPPADLRARLADGPDGIARAVAVNLPGDDSSLVLVVDQFEELYTLVADPERRRRFIDGLVTAVGDPRNRVKVVATLRADFYDRPLRDRDLSRLVIDHQITVTPLGPAELERAIAGPAEAAGVTVEPALIAAVTEDMVAAPAGLPLLQYALTELFDRHAPDPLTLDGYLEVGGMAGAIGTRAEAVFADLGPEAKRAGPTVFGELVTLGEGTEDSRRRAARSSLGAGSGVDELLDRFGQARLLTFDRDPSSRQPTVEVAHEALIRHWPRLRGWIDADRDDIRIGRQLTAAADAWEAGGRDPSDLYRGDRLRTALDWAERSTRPPTTLEETFIEHSDAADRESRRREERANRRLRRLVAAVAVVAAAALVAGAVAVDGQRRARREAAAAETRRMASDAAELAGTDRRLALLLAAEAYRRDPSPTTLGALQTVLVRSAGLVGYVGGDRSYRDVVWVGNDRLLAVTATAVEAIEVATSEVTAEIPVADPRQLALNADRQLVAVSSGDQVWVHDAGLAAVAGPFKSSSPVVSMAFTPDGDLAVGDRDGMVRRWSVTDGRLISELEAHGERSLAELDVGDLGESVPHQPETFPIGTQAIAFSTDGSTMVTAGLAVVRIWDAATRRLRGEILTTRLTPDGNEIATGVDGIWVTGEEVRVATNYGVLGFGLDGAPTVGATIPGRGQTGTVFDPHVDVQVTASGDRAVVAVGGGKLLELSLVGGDQPEFGFDAQLDGAPTVALSPDGARVAYAAGDGIAVIALDGSGPISRVAPSGRPVGEVTVSAAGDLVTVSALDGRPTDFYRLPPSGPAQRVAVRPEPDFAWVGFGPSLVWFDDGRAALLDRSLKPTTAFDLPSMFTMTISLDGRWVANHGEPDAGRPLIEVFDADSGRLVAAIAAESVGWEHATNLVSLAFSPDRSRLVAATVDGAAAIWDTTTWEPVPPALSAGGGAVLLAAYSPDGRWLVTVAADGDITLRDPESLQPVEVLLGNTDAVEGISHGPYFSDDGRYMVTTADGLGRLWDLDARTQVGSIFPSDVGTSPSASDNGRWLATLVDGDAVVWDLDVTRWFDIACRAAGRNLTADEWEQFGPAGEPHRATCPEWPGPERG